MQCVRSPHKGEHTILHFTYKDCKRKTFNNVFLQIYAYPTRRKGQFAYYAPISPEKMQSRVFNFAGSVPFSVSAAISPKPVSFGYRCKVS